MESLYCYQILLSYVVKDSLILFRVGFLYVQIIGHEM
jgi:hypothetical protein